ncbi:coiled-coil domain-containing protein [Crateriforma conspicua]|uniref:Uncharacterized protein n=1 Tax=Crateriforma conspicua TaxID=2527996 RepID=A0A5C5Y1N7_9PLAN|nr:hypothetical protein [Crateriforma conspicua]TWT69134.1 hypothetical protein Pan14r_14180 [Crateriforma conspicua]
MARKTRKRNRRRNSRKPETKVACAPETALPSQNPDATPVDPPEADESTQDPVSDQVPLVESPSVAVPEPVATDGPQSDDAAAPCDVATSDTEADDVRSTDDIDDVVAAIEKAVAMADGHDGDDCGTGQEIEPCFEDIAEAYADQTECPFDGPLPANFEAVADDVANLDDSTSHSDDQAGQETDLGYRPVPSHWTPASPAADSPLTAFAIDQFMPADPVRQQAWTTQPSLAPEAVGPATAMSSELTERLLAEFADLKSHVIEATDLESLKSRIDELTEANESLQKQNDELAEQNADLASRVAGSSVQQSIESDATQPGGSPDLLTWEQRKELIYRQMEEDSFDAESFLTTLKQKQESSGVIAAQAATPGDAESLGDFDLADTVDPADTVARLFDQLESLQQQVERRDDELGELRVLLEQRGPAEDGMTVGAASIAQMFDADELIQEERQRLQDMQADWEEKFRKVEIEASLERAKLSRERQELQRKNAELEERLAHARRECEQNNAGGEGKKRRWAAQLGL